MPKATRKYRSLGLLYKNYRKIAGISQQKAADFLGYESSQIISNFERGLCSLPIPTLFKYSTLLKIPESLFIGSVLSENLYQILESIRPNDFKGQLIHNKDNKKNELLRAN